MTLPPTLDYPRWADTKDTLHLFLQIVGKIRLKAHPKLNHWWHVTLYPSPRGLTTGRIPHFGGGFEIVFDMREHRVVMLRDGGAARVLPVEGLTVAEFYRRLMAGLEGLGVTVPIVATPYDNKSKTPFAEDDAPRAYDGAAVTQFHDTLLAVGDVFERFRGRFGGKQTPVQLYWHSFDLVTTRFSGRAHPMTGGTQSDREAYSHEVISAGFWPGDDRVKQPAFYAYAYPEPDGLKDMPLAPDAAQFVDQNGGALAFLAYADVAAAPDPAGAVLSFLQSFYDGASTLAGWDAEALAHAHATS